MFPRRLSTAIGLCALPAFLSLSPVQAQEQHKHVHGEGRLDVAIEKETVTLHLELPMDVVAGFERAPKSDREKAVLATAAQVLKAADTLFVATPAARCTLHSAQIDIPFTGGNDQHGKHAHEGETHHADIEADYVWRCAQPDALKGIETTLFKSFKRLYRLETQRSGPRGQGAQRLTPKNPVLRWS
jgi:hypothetical protein